VAQPGVNSGHDLATMLDRAAKKASDHHLNARQQRKTSRLHAWADRPGQECRITIIEIR
jgi:hypothetical protein